MAMKPHHREENRVILSINQNCYRNTLKQLKEKEITVSHIM
jgi:hypothetical protein